MRSLILIFCLLGVAVFSAMAGNIVANPGFETGSFAPWVANGSSDHAWCVDCTGPGAFAGAHWASTGCVGAPCITPDPNTGGAWLYQDLTTVATDVYNLSFYFSAAGNTMEFQVLWGPTGGALSVVDDILNIGVTPYNLYSVTALTATTGSTRIEFLGRQDPSYDGLDNVCVDLTSNGVCQVVSGAPEPASLILSGAGLFALGLFRWRRARV